MENQAALNNLLPKLIKDRIGSGLGSVLRWFYYKFTRVELSHVCGEGDVTIVHTTDFVERKDHIDFLTNLAHESNCQIRVVFYRRVFSFFGVFLSIDTKELLNASRILQKNIYEEQLVVFFCPHLVSTYGMFYQAKLAGIRTASLQHGLYHYPRPQYELYKSATSVDVAFIFDLPSMEFFANCTKVLISGYYMFDGKFDYVEETDYKTAVYVTYLAAAELEEFVDYLCTKFSHFDEIFPIKFHPAQDSQSINDVIRKLSERGLVAKSVNFLVSAEVNYFYKTSLYLKFLFNKIPNVIYFDGSITYTSLDEDNFVFDRQMLLKLIRNYNEIR